MDHKQFSRRVVGVVVMLALLLTFLCSNLYTIQYTNGAEYAEQSVSQVSETETVAASRATSSTATAKCWFPTRSATTSPWI